MHAPADLGWVAQTFLSVQQKAHSGRGWGRFSDPGSQKKLGLNRGRSTDPGHDHLAAGVPN